MLNTHLAQLHRLNRRLDALRHTRLDLSFSDLTARYRAMRAIFVADDASCRLFRRAFGDSCSGYVCLDAVLGRCVLAVRGQGGEFFVFDGVSPKEEVDAFFCADDGTGVVAHDEGGGIIRFRAGDGRSVCIDGNVSRLVYRTRRGLV